MREKRKWLNLPLSYQVGNQKTVLQRHIHKLKPILQMNGSTECEDGEVLLTLSTHSFIHSTKTYSPPSMYMTLCKNSEQGRDNPCPVGDTILKYLDWGSTGYSVFPQQENQTYPEKETLELKPEGRVNQSVGLERVRSHVCVISKRNSVCDSPKSGL